MNEVSTDATRTQVAAAGGSAKQVQPATPAAARSEIGNVAPPGGNAVPPPSQKSSAEQQGAAVDKAVSVLNDYVQSQQRDLRFSTDSASGRPVVRVLDSNTEEVIRQIPSDVALRLARNVKDVMEEMRSADTQPSAGAYAAPGNAADLQLINTKV